MPRRLTAIRRLGALLTVLASGCTGAHTQSQATPTASTAPATKTGAPDSTTTAAPAASGPCSGTAPPAAYDHVVVMVMENRSLSQIDGSSSAPYVTRLGQDCGLATDYSSVSHPSLPNYIALTSGSTHGISDDAGPNSHRIAGPSIFSLLGPGWRSLQESMPHDCDVSSGGEYATKHNPAVYYTLVRPACMTQDIPMDDAAPDLSARYTFITPNLCDDGHDCSTASADHWLSVEVPLILQSPQYRAGRTALFITWDENTSVGSQVPTYVVAPSVPPGTRVATPLDHYSLLRTTEELLGLTPLLGAAAGATSMRDAFHL